MKKRVALIVSMMIILACLFVFSVSANEVNPDYNEQYVKTMTQGMLSVELEDGTSVDLYDAEGYTLCYYWDDVASASRKLMSVRTKDLTFNFNGTKLSSIYYGEEYLAGNAKTGKIVVVNLRGVKNSSGQDITDFNGDNMFKEDSPLQHIFMPDTIVHMNTYVFGFRTGSLSHLIGCYFSENSQLQTISNYMFWNCKNLKYFNMPSGVTSIGVAAFFGCESIEEMYIPKGVTSLGHDGSNQSCFGNNKKMYFVNTPGEPKPAVYYLPDNVKEIKGEIFKGCTNLNDVIVFNENITVIEEDYAFNGTNSITLVFLGDVTGLNTQSNKQWKTQKAIYFCHPNDVDMSSFTTVQSNIASNFVFCNAEGNITHLAEKTVTEEAKCEVDAGKYTYCFCGHVISEETIKGTALSHDYDYVNGNGQLISLNYADISKNGTKTVKCGLCGKEDNTIFAKKLFNYLGYSSNDKGDMCVGYDINLDEVKEYETMYGKLDYGFVASANNDTPLDENGNEETNTVKVNLNENKYTRVDFALFSDNWEDEKVASAKITLNMYVIVNNAVKYITANGLSDTAEARTHSEI